MNALPPAIASVSRASAAGGGIVWLGLLAFLPLGDETLGTIGRLLLFAMLVVVPLTLPLAATPDRADRHPLPYRAALVAQPPAAALAAISFFLPAGIPAALFASGWLLFTGLVALFGFARLLSRGPVSAAEASVDAALFYLPVGGVWLVLSRLGARPLGLGEAIVLLTAVHFHYAGFAAPILCGMAGRRLAGTRPAARNLFRWIATGVILGIPLVAAGIAASRLLEVIAAIVLATSLVGLALVNLFLTAPAIQPRLARALLIISSASVVLTMLLAAAYAAGNFTGAVTVSLPTMVRIHGWVNAIGFVLCGLLAWTIALPPSRQPAPGTT